MLIHEIPVRKSVLERFYFSRRETGTIRMTQNWIINDLKLSEYFLLKNQGWGGNLLFLEIRCLPVMGCDSKQTQGKKEFVGFPNPLLIVCSMLDLRTNSSKVEERRNSGKNTNEWGMGISECGTQFFFFFNGKRKEKQADLTDLRELGTFTTGKLCSCML